MPERMTHTYEERSYFVPAALSIAVIVAAGVGAYYFYSQSSGNQYQSVLEQLDASSLPPSFERYSGAKFRLDQLKREPCDREAILPLAELMTKAGYPRESVRSLAKFGERCGTSVELLDPAYDSLIRLGDFKGAVGVASEMIKINPAVPHYRFWRGQAYEGQKNYKAALSDYVSALQFSGNLSRVSLKTFFRVSQMYAAIGRPCDAITPLEMYVSYNASRRQTDQITKLISDWATQGDCRANHAVGGDKVLLSPDGIIDVVINGTRGRMVYDMDRILKAAKKAGVEVRVQVHPDGTIEFETRGMADAPSHQDDPEGISELIKNAK